MDEEQFENNESSYEKPKKENNKQSVEKYQLYYYNQNIIQDLKLIYIE